MKRRTRTRTHMKMRRLTVRRTRTWKRASEQAQVQARARGNPPAATHMKPHQHGHAGTHHAGDPEELRNETHSIGARRRRQLRPLPRRGEYRARKQLQPAAGQHKRRHHQGRLLHVHRQQLRTTCADRLGAQRAHRADEPKHRRERRDVEEGAPQGECVQARLPLLPRQTTHDGHARAHRQVLQRVAERGGNRDPGHVGQFGA